jgi:N6-adenosine-specific RNA methylase IME4
LPVGSFAAPDCALFLWTVDCNLLEALAVGERWGFVYKTVAFTWVKTTKSGGWHISLGYWTRGNPEQCLLFTKGHPKALSHSVRQLVVSPRREHSRKPDECYGHIETLVGGPYVELFARHRRPDGMHGAIN